MTPRRDFGPTDIARQNAAVLVTVGWWLTLLLLPIALVGFAVTTGIGLCHHVVITPSLWFHHLGAGYATVSLRHLIVTLTVTFLGMMLESLVLCRDAFAWGEADGCHRGGSCDRPTALPSNLACGTARGQCAYAAGGKPRR